MKNLRQVIPNILLAVFGVLMLGFGAGYYLAGTSGVGGGTGGYKFLETLQNGLKTASHAKPEVYLYITGMIMAIVFVSLLIVLALASLLGNFQIIKSEKVNKWINIAKLAVAVLVLISFVLVLASVVKMCSGTKLTTGYGLILNVILSVLSIAVLAAESWMNKKKA